MTEKRSFLGILSTSIAFMTGLVSFAANIATVATTLGSPQIQINGIGLGNSLSWCNVAIFSDSTFALTTATYSCIVFIFVGFRISALAGIRVVVSVPPLLLSLWSIAYLQNHPWWCIIAIALSQFWITLLIPPFVTPRGNKPVNEPLNIYIIFLHPLFVFATSAAALRYLRFGTGIWPWISAGIIGLATFAFVLWRVMRINEGETRRRTTLEETLSRRSCDIGDDVSMILKEYIHQRDFFVTPSIPPTKLANARTGCVVPTSEVVLGLIDCTVVGSAKEAIVFTGKAVYYGTSWRQGFLRYVAFPEIEFGISKNRIIFECDATTQTVGIINRTSFLENSSGFSILALSEILESIKRVVSSL